MTNQTSRAQTKPEPRIGQIEQCQCGCTVRWTAYGWYAHRSCDACSDRAHDSERRAVAAGRLS